MINLSSYSLLANIYIFQVRAEAGAELQSNIDSEARARATV